MKRLIALTLALILALAIVACGGDRNNTQSDRSNTPSNAVSDNSGAISDNSGGASSDDAQIDLGAAAESLVEEAVENNSFCVAAADAAIKQRGGSVELFAPDWSYTINEEAMHAYGDTGSYGHGVVRYTKTTDGYLSEEEFQAWVAKAYMATAEISDNGFNIQGFDWGEGIVPKTLDEVLGGFVQTWSYVYNDTIMNVYVEVAKEKDSELIGDPYWDEELEETVWPEWTHYYNGVQIDVGTGSQGEWNWDDLESVFEQYEDEIRDALEGYTN